MPRTKSTVPAYRLHKGTGQAVVYINRREHYLGAYGSSESRQKYAEIIARVTSGESMLVRKGTGSPPTSKSVAALCLRFMAEKLPAYAEAEQHCQRGAMKVLADLFGETPVADFGPLRLRTVRNAMIAGDPRAVDGEGNLKPRKRWSRVFVNRQIKRIKHLFRWGVSWELVPSPVADALSTVESIRAGESDAPESRPRSSVSAERLSAVRAELNDRHRDIFDLLLLTGARPGELLSLTTAAIDRSQEIWRVDLTKHKTAHKGKLRTLFLNLTAQSIIAKYLQADPDKRLFPIRRDNYGQAVKKACERAFGMPRELRFPDPALSSTKLAEIKRLAKAWRQAHVFTPHWLRHTAATKLADDVGVEAAQRLLGHASTAMTEIYTRAAERVAIDAAKRLG